MEFRDKDSLLAFTRDVGHEKASLQAALLDILPYLLARSYYIKHGACPGTPLDGVLEEFRSSVLKDLLSKSEETRERVVNLSQSTRAFVSLGPRGAIIMHARQFEHPRLYTSVINMIEILRGRHFSMIVARTFADDAIRKLGPYLPPGDASNEAIGLGSAEFRQIIGAMMLANNLYGLVVSDPGAFLLDGSMLTAMAEKADSFFHLRDLREDSERKMTALYRLWQHFQDLQRAEILGALRGATQRNSVG